MADCIVGVDLGLGGGIASVPVNTVSDALTLGSIARVWRMPTLPAPKGKGRVYDLPGLLDRLDSWAPDHVFIEAGQLRGAMPGRSSKQAAVSLARCQALFEMVCCAKGYPYTIVRAGTWQRTMFAGLGKVRDTKAASISRVAQLFPDVNLIPDGCKKQHDGLADALLLAEFGRRQLKGASNEDR